MLKRIPALRLLTCLMLVCASALVSPASASSAGIIMTHIQAGSTFGATQEFVALYNDSSQEVDITNWCLRNKSSVDFACFIPSATNIRLYLPARGSAFIGSVPFAESAVGVGFSLIYEPTHASSGSIVASSDTISLVDATGGQVDAVSWTTSFPANMIFERGTLPGQPEAYIDTDSPTDWLPKQVTLLPQDQVQSREVFIDVCPNMEDLQQTVPDGLVLDDTGSCVAPSLPDEETEVQEPLSVLMITELLPNASGSDTGREFIELYNPNDFPLRLDEYQIHIGANFEKVEQFPAGFALQPLSYKGFTNAEIPFSLLNTSSRARIVSGGIVVSETPPYQSPKDDMSWALIDGVWQYSNWPTPGAINQPSIEDVDVVAESAGLKPCASNQYRSPETNRCRLISSVKSRALTPCKDNQYRSEETNRCRNIDGSDDEPAPCKEGQERNPETNRCRAVTKMSSADYGVLGVQTTGSSNWYVWATIGGIILLAGAYAVWEWRAELAKLIGRFAKFARFKK